MSMFTIVHANRCQVCEQKRIPVEKRTVVIIDKEEICGNCGSSLGSIYSIDAHVHAIEHQPMLRTIVRSLVQHGVFGIDPSLGSLNPLRLRREDEELNGLITCHINYSASSGQTPSYHPVKRYRRADIAFVLPKSVSDACDLLGAMRQENLDGSPAFMSFDGADMKRDRKTIRFSWERRVDFDNGKTFNYERVSLEIAWTQVDYAQALPTEAVGAIVETSVDQSEEVRIKEDLVALRAAVWKELTSDSPLRSVAIYCTVSFAEPPKIGALYHQTAVAQVIKELDIIGLHAEIQGPSMMGTTFIMIERKKAS